jgi:hypothetical protein
MVRIFSNFDTQAPTKNYAEAVQEFGFDKAIFLRRHKLYFFLYTLSPAIFAMILLWYLFFSLLNPVTSTNTLISQHVVEVIVSLLALYLILIAWSKYFNYTLDYTIITPWYISSYNQKWLFSREIRTIEPEKIKTIVFYSKGIINSLFNFGKVTILLEWDEDKWEIVIDFIYDPEGVKEAIQFVSDDSINVK